MKPKFIIHPVLAAMVLACTVFAQEKQLTEAEKASKVQAETYLVAFNKGDAKALAALYAEDVQFTSDDGETVIGRPAVFEGLTKFFANNEGAKLVVRVESARFLTPDVLVEKGLSTVGDETTHYVCSYVKKNGVWLISELNETTLPPAAAAEVALGELGWMVGSWKDNSPGITVATTVDWTKNGHFIRRSVSVERDGSDAIEATEIIGYDPVAGGIHSWMFDSEGGFGEGTWMREANKWVVSFSATVPDGTTSSAQHIFTLLDENKYTWESINRQHDGEVLPNLDKVEVLRDPAE